MGSRIWTTPWQKAGVEIINILIYSKHLINASSETTPDTHKNNKQIFELFSKPPDHPTIPAPEVPQFLA